MNERVRDVLLDHMLMRQRQQRVLELDPGLPGRERRRRRALNVPHVDNMGARHAPCVQKLSDVLFGIGIVTAPGFRTRHALLHIDNDEAWKWFVHLCLSPFV
jgi:hypothetical protein